MYGYPSRVLTVLCFNKHMVSYFMSFQFIYYNIFVLYIQEILLLNLRPAYGMMIFVN